MALFEISQRVQIPLVIMRLRSVCRYPWKRISKSGCFLRLGVKKDIGLSERMLIFRQDSLAN